MIICYHTATVAMEKELSVAVAVAEVATAVEKESAVAAVMAVAVEGGCDCCLLYRIYYFIVVDILFYCDGYIILL